jgi:hypothetical protein
MRDRMTIGKAGRLEQDVQRDLELERLADEMLARSNGRAPALTQAQLFRKMKRDAARAAEIDPIGLPDAVWEYLLERHISQRLKGLRLTRIQRMIYAAHLRGLPLTDIADLFAVSRQTIHRSLRRARAEESSRAADKYAGWQEVYWQEVHRYIYRGR